MPNNPNFNFRLLSNVNDYGEDGYNDIWGYVDQNGIEYAVLGTRQATVIYSLEDPSNPVEVANIEGGFSVWRDMKSFGDYIYVTVDFNQDVLLTDGLLVINMTNAPNDITFEFWNPSLLINNQFDQLRVCHNLYIDENGYLYLSGCNLNNGGIIILDVFTTPGTPIFVGAADPRYSHDNFTRGNLVYSSDIFDGFFSIIDVQDKANPVTIATQFTSFTFTHNAWLSDDGNFLFTTDERTFAFVDSYDISDFDNIEFLDSYRPPTASDAGTIPHNTHYFNGYLVTSWYSEGVKIIDATRPDVLVEVGSYDTNARTSGGVGCWGAYPYLPSGIVLASDMTEGLFVLEPNYERASYLEGNITDAVSGESIGNVDYTIASASLEEQSDPFGFYQTGIFGTGSFDITFDHPEYFPTTITVNLTSGETVTQDVQLDPRPRGNIQGRVIEAETGNPIANAMVIAFNDQFQFTARTNANGEYVMVDAILDFYSIGAGKWSYLHDNRTWDFRQSNIAIDFELEEGYQDDFIFDLGWEATDGFPTPSSGRWERGIPIGTNFNGSIANPGADVELDFGRECYVTGNEGGGAGTDDIDDGQVLLTSPNIDLSDYEAPRLSFSYWLFTANTFPLDVLTISINNGTETAVILETTESASVWRRLENIAIADLIDLTANMTIRVALADVNDPQVLEGGFDEFLIVDESTVSTNSIDLEHIQVKAYPNPFQESIRFDYELATEVNQASIRIFNALGQVVDEIRLTGLEGSISWDQQVPAGLYFAQVQIANELVETLRIVKSK